MNKQYSFERLLVWEESRQLVKWVYAVTKTSPVSERFGLVNQMRRASISVVSNLAEGSARKSSRDQAHFFQMAYSSLIEILNHFIISADLGFLSQDGLQEGRQKVEQLTPRISSLRNASLKRQ